MAGYLTAEPRSAHHSRAASTPYAVKWPPISSSPGSPGAKFGRSGRDDRKKITPIQAITAAQRRAMLRRNLDTIPHSTLLFSAVA